MKKLKHTIQKNGVYHFNLRMNDGKIYRKSLGTDSSTGAQKMVERINCLIPRDATPEQIEAVIEAVKQRAATYIQAMRQPHLFPELMQIYTDTNPSDEYGRLRYDQWLQDALMRLRLDTDFLSVSSPAHTIEVESIRRAIMGHDVLALTGREAIQKPEKAKGKQYKDIEEEIRAFFSLDTGKSQVANKMRGYAVFLPFFGGSYISELTHSDIEQAWGIVIESPTGKNIKHYPDGYELEAVLEEHKPSSSTLKDFKACLNGVFTYAQREGWITSNPMAVAKLPNREHRVKTRVALPTQHRERLRQHLEANPEHPLTLPMLLCFYHGFRPSEIAALSPKDIVQDQEARIWYAQVRKGKTANAVRKVPIHHKVLDGLLAHQPYTKTKMFHIPTQGLTQYWNTLRVSLNIPSQNEAGELLSLYSLRHSVVSQLVSKQQVSPELVYKLVGHGSPSITANYVHDYLVAGKEIIDSIV